VASGPYKRPSTFQSIWIFAVNQHPVRIEGCGDTSHQSMIRKSV
jgi:hypothetical protein